MILLLLLLKLKLSLFFVYALNTLKLYKKHSRSWF